MAGVHDLVETADNLHDETSSLAANFAQNLVPEGEHTPASAAEHIHVNLTIFVDGAPVLLPNNFGFGASGAISQFHTHDRTGEIHIEPIGNEPRNRTLTLGDFFNTWRTNAGVSGNNPNAILSPTQLLNNVTNTTDTLKMFVNGQHSAAFANHLLHDGDNITLVYGSDPVVSLNTTFGSIVVELFENETPGTVNNFLNYVNDGDYINAIFHRSASSPAVIQGGGFRTNSNTFTSTAQFTTVPTDPPILNEPGISNIRGTIAMAKTDQLNSATNQFFINTSSNTLLDNPNTPSNTGGFTVFGQILDMRSSDRIRALPTRTNAQPFNQLPVSADNQLAVIQSIVGRGEISGTHFNDTNRNGTRETGETAVVGATIFIDANNNGVLDTGELSATTDSTGRYLFQVDPGTYRVRAQIASGLRLTAPTTGDSYSVTVQIGREVINRNFGVAIDNDSPITQPDTYTVNEDAVLTVVVANGVLANDTSRTSAPLTATVNTQPANGSLTLNSNGSFTYTPTANFFGTDTFRYIASDGTIRGNPVTVTVTVNAQPDAPVAVADTLTISNSRTPITVNVLANDTSAPDAVQTLTVTSVTQGTAGGTVTLANGIVTYLAPLGFVGTDTFNYTIRDTDNLTSSATATITVTDVAKNSLSGFVYLDTDGNGVRDTGEAGVPGTQITLTGAGLTRTILTDSTGAYSFTELPNGTYQLVERQPMALLDGADSTTASNAVVGNDQITAIALNGGQTVTGNNFGEKGIQSQYLSIAWFYASSGSSNGMFRETVAMGEQMAGNSALAAAIRASSTTVPGGGSTGNPPPSGTNTAPVANGDTFTVNENAVLTVTAANGVLRNDTDANGDSLTATVLTQPANGTLAPAANGSFTYTPTSEFFGTDSFTYRASDGTAVSNTATVTITVIEVPPANQNLATPVAVADTYSVERNGSLAVSSSLGVLLNDTDADGDTLTAQRVADPSNGTLVLSSDGSFSYVPNAGFAGTDTFTYRASDGTRTSTAATVTITVIAGNVAPLTEVDSYMLNEDSSITVNAANGLLANDSDPEGATLTAIRVEGPAHGALTLNADGSFTYTPVANFSATDSFTYAASDGVRTSGATTVTLLVQGVEDTPVGVNDSYAVDPGGVLNVTVANGVLANDIDVDADTLTAVQLTSPANGMLTLNGDGSFNYEPDDGFVGTDSFTYQANDGFFDSNTVTVTISVTTANLVRIRLEAATSDGTPIDTIAAGQNFVVRAFVEDIRSAPQGVFAAFTDVTYNPSVASVSGPIVFAPAFPNGRTGTATSPNLIDEVGAFRQQSSGAGEMLLFTIPFVANSAGNLDLNLDPADNFPTSDTLLFGLNTAVPTAQIEFVTDSLTVTAASGEGEGSGLAEFAASADHVFAAEDDWLQP